MTDGRDLRELGASNPPRADMAVGGPGTELLRETRGFLWVGLPGQAVLHIPGQSRAVGSMVERLAYGARLFVLHPELADRTVTAVTAGSDGSVWTGTIPER